MKKFLPGYKYRVKLTLQCFNILRAQSETYIFLSLSFSHRTQWPHHAALAHIHNPEMIINIY